MKRLTLFVVVLALLFTLPAMAQSAKATAKVSSIISFSDTLVGGGNNNANPESDWTDILSNSIKTANQKDLFVNASLECGLLTRTVVRSKGGTPDTSSASAGVEVRVVLDKGTANETVFEPKTLADGSEDEGQVVFCRRTQTLTAMFLGLDCSADLLTGEVTCVDPEELGLILDTMNANSFNFYLGDVRSGNHTITVQARIALNNTVQTGEVEAQAFLGKGSVTMESVRLIKNEDVVDIQ